MQSSLVIAQILGPMYVIVAVGLLLNTPAYQRIFEEFFENPALAYLSLNDSNGLTHPQCSSLIRSSPPFMPRRNTPQSQ